MKKETKRVLIIICIILLLAASRLLKHPYNFTPITAMSIFAGCYLRKHWGLVFPLGAMLLGDFFIGFYDWKLMAAVYVGIGISFYVGWYLRNGLVWYSVPLAALVSSVSFFIVSNVAVWFFYEWYPHTITGLTQCFALAIPFFKNSLAGDLIYTMVVFGAYEAAKKYFMRQITFKANQKTI
jgi:hypothetical protein